MQQIIDECGCGKSLLYREFASKDELVVAYLEHAQAQWSEIMDDAVRPYADDPGAQLVALVQAVADQVAAPDYSGCPFRMTHAQFPDPDHPAHQVAVRHVRDLRARLRRLARRAGRRPRGARRSPDAGHRRCLYERLDPRPPRRLPAAVAFAESVVNQATGSTTG